MTSPQQRKGNLRRCYGVKLNGVFETLEKHAIPKDKIFKAKKLTNLTKGSVGYKFVKGRFL